MVKVVRLWRRFDVAYGGLKMEARREDGRVMVITEHHSRQRFCVALLLLFY